MDMNMRPDTQEAAMARADLYKMANYSFKLFKMIKDGDQLEGWVQAKITKAADYVASVYHYLEYEMKFSEYGNAIENSDMYSEAVKQEFKTKLMEAKKKLEKLKNVEEGFPTVADAKARAEKGKTTGKFDKKEIKPGVTQYTRKSSTFSDGGDDKDVKAAKKKAKANEGIADMAKKAGSAIKKAGSKALVKLGHGSDEDLIKDLQKKVGVPQTGKKPMATKNEALKGGQKNLDADKDGKLEKSDFAKLRASKGVKEASHQEKTTMKHVKNPTAGEKKAAKDIKPGVKGYADRVAMLKSAEKDGRLKEASKPDLLDMDKDGNKKEQMKKAVADKKAPPKKGVNPFAKK